MGMQTPSCCLHNYPSSIISPSNHSLLSHHKVSTRIASIFAGSRQQKLVLNNKSKSYFLHGLNRDSSLSSLNRGLVVHASKKEDNFSLPKLNDINLGQADPFPGKSGSMSFSGITHELIQESELVVAAFDEDSGSYLWVLAPIALISSLVLSQVVVLYISASFSFKPIISELVDSFTSDIIFYIGLSIFLKITDQIQKPYLRFSPKRWGLITGLRGYLTSAFFATGFKISAPLFALGATWTILGLPALVSVAPFLTSFLVQIVFEKSLEKREYSCWPLVPLLFEVYRLYQLSKSLSFMKRLMMSINGVELTDKVMAGSGALLGMVLTFQVVGFACLWSLLTFLMRLFPTIPVEEN